MTADRDAEALSLFAAIINKLREKVQSEVPRIFEAVFECTLTMITKNFEVGPVDVQIRVSTLLKCFTPCLELTNLGLEVLILPTMQ